MINYAIGGGYFEMYKGFYLFNCTSFNTLPSKLYNMIYISNLIFIN